jgi:hypothetical protein
MAKPLSILDIADPVDEAPQPAAPSATPPPAAPANDESLSAIAEPVQDQPAQVVDTAQHEGGFRDQLPEQVASTLAPDEAKEFTRILSEEPLDHAGDLARRWLAAKGFEPSPATDPKFKGDSIDQVLAYRKAHGQVSSDVNYLKPAPLPDDGAAGAAARGIADVPTSGFMDEMYGVAQALQNPSGYGFDHDINANIDKYRGTVERDEKDHPIARIAGQMFGGLGIPIAYEGTAMREFVPAARAAMASGATREAAIAAGRQAASAAVRNAMIRDGAYIGAAHGVGSGEGIKGRIGEGAIEAGLGGVGGAVVGVAGQAVGGKIGATAARNVPLTEEQQLIQAADRQGIQVLPADVGGPTTRRATSMVTQTIAGGKPIIDRAKTMTAQAQTARDSTAATIGQALQPEAAGQQGISGAQKYIASSGAEARRFYGAAESASKGVTIDAPKALAVLDQNISDLAETPGGTPGLTTLQGLRDALAKGNLSVAGIRRMRTVLRDQFIKDGLTGSDLERRVGQVLDAASEDVRDGLSAKGLPDAAQNFAAGDAAWKARARTIDTVIEPLIGTREKPKSGEQVIKTLTADLQGNNARAVAFLKALPPEEQSNVRASIIGAMGKAAAGQQGSEGKDFSLNTFLTHWNQVGESAKNAYFGPEARAALNDLAQVAEGTREAQRYHNMSNTGGVVGNLLTLFSGAGGVATFGKMIGTQYGLGRLLASPRFARWLARAPKARNPRAYTERLAGIARAEPAISADILSLQQRLADAFKAAPMQAAASDNPDSGQKQ